MIHGLLQTAKGVHGINKSEIILLYFLKTNKILSIPLQQPLKT